jgi:polyhydroxybutyrate depolymerase
MKRALLLPSMLVACTGTPAGQGEVTGETDTDGESESDSEDGLPGSESETDETDTGEPEPLCDGGGLGPGDHVLELEFDDRSRVFQVHVPPGYDGTVATPLVVNFHGLGSNGTQQTFFSNMNPTADAEGFVVVYPEGTVNADGRRAWNAGGCCTDDPEIDDVGFVRAMLDELDTQLCIDPDSRFATGMSNGGLMSYRIGCEAADLFAAVAPVAGLLALTPSACNPTRALPLWQIHGTIDELVPFDGAHDSAVFWAAENGCTTQTRVSYQNGVVTCEAWSCAAASEVVFCTAEGVNHCWPGQPFCIDPPSTEDIDSTATIWAFFAAHPMSP